MALKFSAVKLAEEAKNQIRDGRGVGGEKLFSVEQQHALCDVIDRLTMALDVQTDPKKQ